MVPPQTLAKNKLKHTCTYCIYCHTYKTNENTDIKDEHYWEEFIILIVKLGLKTLTGGNERKNVCLMKAN